MNMHVLPNRDVSYLNPILRDEDGFLRVVLAETLHAIDHVDLMIWGHKNGVYQFPTTELIDWLAKQIDGVSAIEIGAGLGAIGRALKIPITDSHQQDTPEMRAHYAAIMQPTIAYPKDVQRMDAAEAIRRYNPHTVIGAWVTEKWRAGKDYGNKDGIDWDWVLGRVRRVILIGNEKVHGPSRVMARPHQELEFPWIVSRARAPEFNRIYIWEGDSSA
jgi:hypothetical protein